MLGEYPLFDSFCAAVFMVGTFVLILGLINNLYVWTKGTGKGFGQIILGIGRAFLSRKMGKFISAVIDIL